MIRMTPTVSASENRQLHRELVERAIKLDRIGTGCYQAIRKFLGDNFYKELDADMGNRELYYFVKRYSDNLFRAELHIVNHVRQLEWLHKDKRLLHLDIVATMQEQAEEFGFGLTMKPEGFTMTFGKVKTDCFYEDGSIKEGWNLLDRQCRAVRPEAFAFTK